VRAFAVVALAGVAAERALGVAAEPTQSVRAALRGLLY